MQKRDSRKIHCREGILEPAFMDMDQSLVITNQVERFSDLVRISFAILWKKMSINEGTVL
jgi:hypothetical protein